MIATPFSRECFLALYLQEYPKVSPVRAMRKVAATPEESMHFWALCANVVEDGL